MDLFIIALPGSGLPQAAQVIAHGRGVRAAWLETDLTRAESPDVIPGGLLWNGFDKEVKDAGASRS